MEKGISKLAKVVATEARKVTKKANEEDELNSFEYIFSLLVNGNISLYKERLANMTGREIVQYINWAEEMGIGKEKLRLNYIESSKKQRFLKKAKLNKKAWDGEDVEDNDEEINEYDVPVKITFRGNVYCKATSQDDANSIVVNNFGALLGRCEDNSDGEIVDWDIETHGDTDLDEENKVSSKKTKLSKKADNSLAEIVKEDIENIEMCLENIQTTYASEKLTSILTELQSKLDSSKTENDLSDLF